MTVNHSQRKPSLTASHSGCTVLNRNKVTEFRTKVIVITRTELFRRSEFFHLWLCCNLYHICSQAARCSNCVQRGQTELFNIPHFNPCSCQWLQHVKCIEGETLSAFREEKGGEIVCGVCKSCDGRVDRFEETLSIPEWLGGMK
jgi:hypothetical protein